MIANDVRAGGEGKEWLKAGSSSESLCDLCLDGNHKLCGIHAMKDEQGRGPIVFTALYAGGWFLMVVALMWHDRWDAELLKAWAPLIQAVLGAAAIFSAWLLQDTKRRSDLRDQQKALEVAYQVISYELEEWAAWMASRAADGTVTKRFLQINAPHFREEVDALRGLPLENIRDATALRRAHLFNIACREFVTMLEHAETRVAAPGGVLTKTFFDKRLSNMIARRTKMLNAFRLPSEPGRLNAYPAAKALISSDK